MRKVSLALLLCLLCLAGMAQGQKALDLKDITSGRFRPENIQGVIPMPDGEHYTQMSADGTQIIKYSFRTGEKVEVIFDVNQARECDFKNFDSYQFSPDGDKLLIATRTTPIYRHSYTAVHYIYPLKRNDKGVTTNNIIERLSDGGPQQVPVFSPDGTMIAFVRDNNIFLVKLLYGNSESQVTEDGKQNSVLNGIPDWVYEEEFAFARAFEWSPDGRRIAWLRFDESRVREYNMNRFDGKLYPENYTFKYPKAGEENSIVELYCHDLETGETVRIDTGGETDRYIPRLLWTPSGELAFYRLNRLQNHFEVLLSDRNGATRVVYNERDERYVEHADRSTVTFLPDGDRFVVRSERNGYMHLYLHSIRKGFLKQLTDGQWEVTAMLGVSDDRVYYLSTETSPLRRDLYAVRLDGKDKKRLTGGDGTYNILPSEGFRYYISYFSNVETPERITLHAADGRLIRTLEDNAALRDTLAERGVPVKEFFTFRNSEGIELNGYLLRPGDFDPAKKYPVLMTQYSGPGSQQVADRWTMDWTDVLAQQGYIVACVDGRGTGFRGESFRKCTYRQLGRYETEDQIEAARYLGSLPYVDGSRIGIYGWSYGGFMALNCILKGNDVFRIAIAVAPVTSWRFYDTVYTEIYNGMPQDNPSGYDDNSPIRFADRLEGKLLIAHGTADDNVHIQNTYEMAAQLTAHGKPFEMRIYPDKNHSMGNARHHLLERCIEFVKENL